MNRPYVYRGRKIPGIYQRCTAKCGPDKCAQHRWQYEIELPPGPDGTRQRDVKGGFETAREALDARAEVLREFKAGNRPLDPKLTLGEWLPKWLAARVERGELRDGTVEDYQDSITRFLIPRLGHMKLVELRAAHITAAYDAMRRDRVAEIKAAEEINAQRRAEAQAKNKVKHSGRPRVPRLVRVPRTLGPHTMRRIHNTLSGALKSATRAGLIPRNPAPDAELPKVVMPKVKVWTAEQLGTFLDAIEGQRLYPLYHLAAFAGMRRGELCGISWDDVDLDHGRIVVAWQITDKSYRNARRAEKEGKRGRYRSKPKTRAGEDRIVDLDDVSVNVLREWRETQDRERREWGKAYATPPDEGGPLVFTREDGRPLDPKVTHLKFVRLVKEAGLSHLKLHGLRHMNISLQLEAGVSETIIAMRVGHTSPELIRSTYGHLIGTIGKRAAEATAALIPLKRKAEEPKIKKAS
ncbi:tyrosine-type recombinase/integrase [Phytohabitans kaempferiae]|uniref:Tyrosine-type recombinase/integrase n=1 Tax=Phytohabitans kaempferiae TaxID=1620943 RepID=A0ABV6ME08_9ACTN